jgi:hypothetical protein
MTQFAPEDHLDCPRCGERRDYIPGGEPAYQATNLRKIEGYARCGASIGSDLQSGPFYCGDRATWMADSQGGFMCVCDRHKNILERIIMTEADRPA